MFNVIVTDIIYEQYHLMSIVVMTIIDLINDLMITDVMTNTVYLMTGRKGAKLLLRLELQITDFKAGKNF